MSKILDDRKCRCIKKKRKSSISNGKPLKYPDSTELMSKTFQIRYDKKLSSIAKLLLHNFENKYLYYAIDDVLYLFKLNKVERDNLLAILYYPVLSLHNNLSINFFDIWIKEIYINEVPKTNKFLRNDFHQIELFHDITLKILYKPKSTIKQKKYLW